MDLDAENLPELDASEGADALAARTSPVFASLPSALVFTERATAMLRAYLNENGLGTYRIFHSGEFDLTDVDDHLDALGESAAAWEPLAPTTGDHGEPLSELEQGGDDAGDDDDDDAPIRRSAEPRVRDSGCLRLERYRVIFARWYWAAHGEYGYVRRVWLIAAPSAADYAKLRAEVLRLRRARGEARWGLIGTESYRKEYVERDPRAGDALVLAPAVRERIEMDVVRFFSPEVAELYRTLGVPHRRGVLLYGPPGNGKTSLLRLIGAALPRVPGLILRPDKAIESDAFAHVIRRWTQMAPAILVIEDLDWLLKALNVSAFLNLIDGIESTARGGLLLLATTNHPEQLDPAVNNRPGRFDVAIEIPNPDAATRLEFLRAKLPAFDEATHTRAAALTDRLSFAHLQEVLRLSGLMAIQSGRRERTPEDLIRAAESVRAANEEAWRGFPGKPDLPFGLGPLREMRKAKGV